MKLKYVLTLGKPFGIKVSVHWTFLLIIAWVVYIDIQQGLSVNQILYSVLFVLFIFLCVVIHELSHSLTARKYSIPTRSITLLPIGGVADLEKMPDDPKQELAVSVAGPISNLIIAAILWILLSITGNFDLQAQDFEAINRSNFLIILTFANLMLAAFNLLPVFPMDGGRVLRSILALKLPREQATYIAMNIGKFLAVGLGILGLYINPFLIVIAVFVFLGAQREYEMVRYSSVLSGYKVKDILIKEYTPLRPDDPIQKAVDILLSTPEQRFVVAEEGNIRGMLTRNDIIKGLMNYDRDEEISLIMNKDVTVFREDTTLEKAFEQMRNQRITMVPVVDKQGRLTGIIDTENINEFIMVRNARSGK
jgi:Zn-dependent protease